jgi:hypothetical protein
MTSVPTAVAIMVAKKTAAQGIPLSDKRFGFTKIMYTMVKKVVKPATTSL